MSLTALSNHGPFVCSQWAWMQSRVTKLGEFSESRTPGIA